MKNVYCWFDKQKRKNTCDVSFIFNFIKVGRSIKINFISFKITLSVFLCDNKKVFECILKKFSSLEFELQTGKWEMRFFNKTCCKMFL